MKYRANAQAAALLAVICGMIAFAVYGVKEYRSSRQAEILVQKGSEAFREGRFHQAEDLFSKAVSTSPDYAAARLNLGICLEKKGKHLEAIESLEKAVRLTHNPAIITEARLGLAGIYGNQDISPPVREKDWAEKAVWNLERVIEAEPGNPGHYLSLGFAAFNAAQPGKGLNAMKKASELATEPGDLWIHEKILAFYINANMKDGIAEEKKKIELLTAGKRESGNPAGE